MKKFSDYDVVNYVSDIKNSSGIGFYFWVHDNEIVSPLLNGFNAICRWLYECPRFNSGASGDVLWDLYYTPNLCSHYCAKVDL